MQRGPIEDSGAGTWAAGRLFRRPGFLWTNLTLERHDMKAKVNEAQCAGSGACEQICPKVFKVVGGISKVQVDPVPADDEASCREAADACPTEAITIED